MLPAAVRETHVSTLFFVGDRAYKLKKPVTLDFVDLSTREARERLCRREVELNRRLAPDVYLGVADVTGPDGRPCDHLVVMRRMPEERRLATLVAAGADVGPCLREIARVLAAFHARADRSPLIDAAAAVEQVRARWEASFATMEPFVGTVLDADVVTRIARNVRRYLDGRAALFERRIAQGAVCDGHGDLLADDVFCFGDGPRILDCLEFDDSLRYGDVLADVAFLAMDLERLGRPDLSSAFLAWYREFSAETHPDSLAHHYVAYRAHVRSKVACLRGAQGDATAAASAAAHLALADEHLRRGRVVMTLVGGLPGTGKSTLAADLAARLGWTVLRTDEVRKDLAGLAHAKHGTDGFGAGLYDEQITQATYAALLDRARSLLALGEPVVLDASWGSAARRDDARMVADAMCADLVELRCEAPRAVTHDRLLARAALGADPSDATPLVADAMAATADPWPEAVAVDTTGDPADTTRVALTRL
ncbi:MAG: bifunctional aminoglycoside phosphotransferase/ATP-binding protein [Acidimicrobiia bacterium]